MVSTPYVVPCNQIVAKPQFREMKASDIVRPFRPLIVRKERWGLSWRGRIIVALAVLLIVWWSALSIHPFLAVTHRTPARILVVEGWVHFYGVDAAVAEFKTGRYDRILTTGGPEDGMGNSAAIYDTDAWQSAGFLKKAGIPAEVVQSVPSRFVGRDRTYNSAITLRDWFRENDPKVSNINVLTEDTHARRTRMLFQKALGPGIQVGIISAANPDYDARHWWRFSTGVRQVIDESIAYIYAKFFFWPGSKQQV